MRLFYQIGGTTKWNETALEKMDFLPQDVIICHNKELHDTVSGMALLTGLHYPVVPYKTTRLELNKHAISNDAIAFFTKIPDAKLERNLLNDSFLITIKPDYYD